MAKIGKLPPGIAQLAGPNRRPGQYYIRSTKRGLVAQSWPKKRSGSKTPAQVYREAEFSMASRFASNPAPENLKAAIAASEGTYMVPRDFLTGMAYGTLMQLFFEDGTEWTRYRDVTINAQLVLDQVTDEVGSILFREQDGWFGVTPGSNGQYLQIVNNVAQWVTVGAPGATVPLQSVPAGITPGAGTNVPANTLTGSYHQLNAGTVVNGIAIYANAAAATCRVTPGLYRPTLGVGTPRMTKGPSVTGVALGWNLLPFDAQYLVTQSDVYAAAVQVGVILFQQVNILPAPAKFVATNAFPLPDPLVVTGIAQDNVKVNAYLY